jgi:multidrug efflux pump subunit AcrB
MGLTRLAIARPIAILMLVSAFLVIGLIGYFQLPAELNPDIAFPAITIYTSYTGTDPQEMETLITKPIEDSIAGVSGIEEIDSTSESGVSVVRISFYFGTDLDTADAQVIQKVDAIRSTLPVAATSPSVREANTNGQPILVIAMQSNSETQAQLQTMATNIVQPALEQATDVGEVDISNVTQREIHVDINPTKLASYGVTVPDIVTAIGGANVNVASGFIESGAQYYDVRLIGEFTSVAELRNLRMNLGGGSSQVGPGNQSTAAGLGSTPSYLTSSSSAVSTSKTLYLSDVATVSDTIAQPTYAVSGSAASGSRGLLLPAQRAWNAHCRDRHTDVDDRHVYPTLGFRLLAEPDESAGFVAGGRHSSRRLHCRPGKHQQTLKARRRAGRRGH